MDVVHETESDGGATEGSDHGTDPTLPTSLRVVEAVADREGEDPIELSEPLYEVVDPDALDRLVQGADDELTLSFGYYGYRITVHGDGEIVVTEE